MGMSASQSFPENEMKVGTELGIVPGTQQAGSESEFVSLLCWEASCLSSMLQTYDCLSNSIVLIS